MTENTLKIEVARRSWYEWLAWVVWLFALAFMVQNAIASGVEYEPTAATIFWAISAVLLIGGAIVYFLRRKRLME